MGLDWPRIIANTVMAWINAAFFAFGCWVLDVDMTSDLFYVGILLILLLTPNVDD